MIKTVPYVALFLFLGIILPVYGMDLNKRPDSYIKLQEVLKGQKLELCPAAVIQDGFECFDPSKDEPMLMTPFCELMNAKAQYGIPFLLAAVSLQVPSKDSAVGSATVRRALYEAAGLNKVLFGNIEFNAETNRYHYYKNRLRMAPQQFLDPYSKQFITGIQYFTIAPLASTATELASDFDLFVPSPAQQFLVRLFDLHNKITAELDAREMDPHHSSSQLYNILLQLADHYRTKKKWQEAESYCKQAADQNDDLEIKTEAVDNLIRLYGEQDKLQEAEYYLKLAANQNDNPILKVKAIGGLGWLYNEQKNCKKQSII